MQEYTGKPLNNIRRQMLLIIFWYAVKSLLTYGKPSRVFKVQKAFKGWFSGPPHGDFPWLFGDVNPYFLSPYKTPHYTGSQTEIREILVLLITIQWWNHGSHFTSPGQLSGSQVQSNHLLWKTRLLQHKPMGYYSTEKFISLLSEMH